jgi:hypothetical protein
MCHVSAEDKKRREPDTPSHSTLLVSMLRHVAADGAAAGPTALPIGPTSSPLDAATPPAFSPSTFANVDTLSAASPSPLGGAHISRNLFRNLPGRPGERNFRKYCLTCAPRPPRPSLRHTSTYTGLRIRVRPCMPVRWPDLTRALVLLHTPTGTRHPYIRTSPRATQPTLRLL